MNHPNFKNTNSKTKPSVCRYCDGVVSYNPSVVKRLYEREFWKSDKPLTLHFECKVLAGLISEAEQARMEAQFKKGEGIYI